MKGRKIDLQEAKCFFLQNGCELLEDRYENNSVPMRYRCSCGCESTISFGNFRKGSRCYQCGVHKANSKKSHNYEYVKKCFDDAGCELLESEYKNNYTPMRYRCSCGSESEIRFFCLIKGQRCEKCDGGRGSTHYNWNPNREEVKVNKRFRSRQGHMVRSVLNSLGKSKKYKASKYLGYETEDLKEHITSHSNWEEVKDGHWHIDHIFPIKAFLDYNISDVKTINCLDNLQPLSAKENLSKNDSYDKKEFEEWLSKRKLFK